MSAVREWLVFVALGLMWGSSYVKASPESELLRRRALECVAAR